MGHPLFGNVLFQILVALLVPGGPALVAAYYARRWQTKRKQRPATPPA